MQTLSLKLPDTLLQEINEISEERGISKSSFIREAVTQYLHGGSTSPQSGSFLDLASDLCGSVAGPKDLSTNKKHLEGYGE